MIYPSLQGGHFSSCLLSSRDKGCTVNIGHPVHLTTSTGIIVWYTFLGFFHDIFCPSFLNIVIAKVVNNLNFLIKKALKNSSANCKPFFNPSLKHTDVVGLRFGHKASLKGWLIDRYLMIHICKDFFWFDSIRFHVITFELILILVLPGLGSLIARLTHVHLYLSCINII